MSEYKPSDVKIEEKPQGTVSFATDVIATIAGLAATEVEGVASMNNTSSGIADMFSRKATKNFTKGVHIELVDDKVDVDITIVVDFGSPIPDVARGIQENVKKAIETMAGLSVRSINIHVSGISFEKEMQAARELDEQQKKMLRPEAPIAPKEPEKAPAAAETVESEEQEPAAEPEPKSEEASDEISDESEEAEADEAEQQAGETEYVEFEYEEVAEASSEEPESEYEFDEQSKAEAEEGAEEDIDDQTSEGDTAQEEE